MSQKHRLIILGTGGIAARHAEKFGELETIEIVAAVDSNLERAKTFAEAHGIAKAFGSLDEAIGWGAFDAAVNSTPDNVHKPTTLQLIAADKHVFCEKPLAVKMGSSDAAQQAAALESLVSAFSGAALPKEEVLTNVDLLLKWMSIWG